MNAKTCKKLRAQARAATVGKPPFLFRRVYRLLKSRSRARVTFEGVRASMAHSAALVELEQRRQRRRRAAARR